MLKITVPLLEACLPPEGILQNCQFSLVYISVYLENKSNSKLIKAFYMVESFVMAIK